MSARKRRGVLREREREFAPGAKPWFRDMAPAMTKEQSNKREINNRSTLHMKNNKSSSKFRNIISINGNNDSKDLSVATEINNATGAIVGRVYVFRMSTSSLPCPLSLFLFLY